MLFLWANKQCCYKQHYLLTEWNTHLSKLGYIIFFQKYLKRYLDKGTSWFSMYSSHYITSKFAPLKRQMFFSPPSTFFRPFHQGQLAPTVIVALTCIRSQQVKKETSKLVLIHSFHLFSKTTDRIVCWLHHSQTGMEESKKASGTSERG